MSSKKSYEITSASDVLIKPFDTVDVPTNSFVKVEDNELFFFKIEESLYKAHGLVALEPFIEEKDYSRLHIKLSKICMIRLSNIGNPTLHETMFGIGNEFRIKESTVLGTLTVVTL